MPRTSNRRSSATAEISPELLEQAAGALKRIARQNGVAGKAAPGVRDLDLGKLASELSDAFHRLAAEHVQAANAAGASWACIGEAFDVTAQSAHERFRSR